MQLSDLQFTESVLLNQSTDHLIDVIIGEYTLDVPAILDDEVWGGNPKGRK